MRLLVLAVVLCSSCAAHALAQSLANELRPFAFPLSATGAEAHEVDPVVAAVSGARVIGLGEPTHGTAEVFCLMQRVIQRLVEDAGVRHLVLEASVGEGADFDDYVAGGRDDLEALRHGIPLWMFQADEFASVLRWLRTYNQTAERPVPTFRKTRSIRHRKWTQPGSHTPEPRST
jgi:erythromycin esterase